MGREFIQPEFPAVWKVEQLRLSLFLSESHRSPGDLWSSVAGTEPNSENTERNGAFTVYQASGTINELTPTLRVEPNRVDWTIGFGMNPVGGGIPVGVEVGDYLPTSRAFVELLRPFVANNLLTVNRLAFGAVLSLPVQDREEGYAVVSSLLPFDLDLNSRDFFYRINRPRPARSYDIDLNRLNDWLVLEVFSLPLMFNQLQSIDPAKPNSVVNVSTFAARCQIDVNTNPQQTFTATPEQQVALLDEMHELTTELATEGDVP